MWKVFCGLKRAEFEPDDWIARLAVAVFYLIFGLEKFGSEPHSEWVVMFQQIGFGTWFRYLAGIVEVAGAVLVAVPRTALMGLALLAATMASAIAILSFMLGRPGDAPFPGIFLAAVATIGLVRWREISIQL